MASLPQCIGMVTIITPTLQMKRRRLRAVKPVVTLLVRKIRDLILTVYNQKTTVLIMDHTKDVCVAGYADTYL